MGGGVGVGMREGGFEVKGVGGRCVCQDMYGLFGLITIFGYVPAAQATQCTALPELSQWCAAWLRAAGTQIGLVAQLLPELSRAGFQQHYSQ